MLVGERFRKTIRGVGLLIAVIILVVGMLMGSQHLVSFREPQLAAVSAARVVSLTNEERADKNLPPLQVSELLTQAAQLKAEDMADREYYAHISPDGKTPLYWLDRVGYKYLNAGENLVIDRNSSEQVVSAWMDSSDHRKNILRSQFTEIGVGIAHGRYKGEDTIYVAQLFGTPYPSVPLVRETPQRVPTRTITPTPATPAPARSPDPIPVPTLSSKPVVPVAPNSLISRVQTLTAPVLESLQPSTTTASTSPAREPRFGLTEPAFTIELPSAPLSQPAEPKLAVLLEGMREYLRTLGTRIAELWGWSDS